MVRGWERRWWLWWGDMCRMRWTSEHGEVRMYGHDVVRLTCIRKPTHSQIYTDDLYGRFLMNKRLWGTFLANCYHVWHQLSFLRQFLPLKSKFVYLLWQTGFSFRRTSSGPYEGVEGSPMDPAYRRHVSQAFHVNVVFQPLRYTVLSLPSGDS